MCKVPKIPIPQALEPRQTPRTPDIGQLATRSPFAPMPSVAMAVQKRVGSIGNDLIGSTTALGGAKT